MKVWSEFGWLCCSLVKTYLIDKSKSAPIVHRANSDLSYRFATAESTIHSSANLGINERLMICSTARPPVLGRYCDQPRTE